IVELLPAHEHYVEPFAGSLAVLLKKPRSAMETVNDLDGDLMNFWQVLRDRPEDLARVCSLTPHSRAEHQAAYDLDGLDDLERARRVWVCLSQGRNGTLRRTGWRFYEKPRGGMSMPGYLGSYVDRIAPCAERLAGVSLEGRYAGGHRAEMKAWTGNGIRNGASKTDGDRTEVLWSNRSFPEADLPLFEVTA